jgi:hypothetical protein
LIHDIASSCSVRGNDAIELASAAERTERRTNGGDGVDHERVAADGDPSGRSNTAGLSGKAANKSTSFEVEHPALD